MTERMYCGHCEEQIASCLAAARDAQNSRIRSFFLTLADKWMRLGGDLEELHSCGSGCPLSKVCGRDNRPAAAPQPELPRAVA